MTSKEKMAYDWAISLCGGPRIMARSCGPVAINHAKTLARHLRDDTKLVALQAISNMQVNENTDISEVLAICISIARIEVNKAESEV